MFEIFQTGVNLVGGPATFGAIVITHMLGDGQFTVS